MYCSETCKDQHEKMFHSTVCHEDSLESSAKQEPRIRLLNIAVKELDSFDEFYKLLKNPPKATIFDIDEFTPKNFFSVISSLPVYENKQSLEIKKHIKGTEHKTVVKFSTERLFSLLSSNQMVCKEMRLTNRCWTPFITGYQVCLIAPLINHSCDPNIKFVSYDDKIVYFAIRPIKAGEQLFMSYGPKSSIASLKDRRKALKEFDIYKCYCDACKFNYPMSEFPKVLIAPINFDTSSVVELIEYFKNNCKLIEKYRHDRQYSETNLLMDYNNIVSYLIGKMRL